MTAVPMPDPERLLEMSERTAFYQPAATRAAEVAREIAAGGRGLWGGPKVLLIDVAHGLGYASVNPVFARLLAAWQRLGWLRLCRVDLAGAVDAQQLEASELVVGGLSTFHAVDTSRQNPAISLATASPEAEAKFREFHQKPPRKVGAFSDELVIPREVELLGDAIHVLYRSDKVDPETGEQPRAPINYIHEHDSFGVQTFAPARRPRKGAITATTPMFLRDAEGLVLLGDCLGLAYHAAGVDVELESDAPYDELYTTPCGRALVVVTGKREITFLVWGGELGVEDRGIVG
jgi:hypothetical protein